MHLENGRFHSPSYVRVLNPKRLADVEDRVLRPTPSSALYHSLHPGKVIFVYLIVIRNYGNLGHLTFFTGIL